ncbi:MAG: NitT/TauT family transport system substrate-binding protein [Campylobacterota bacterium]|nr:NitT/TauT family transport system substrate-binding protein [Campylobacterota bacterium]
MKSRMMGLIAAALMLSSCSEVTQKDPLVLSVDTWIGLAPFYYAHSKGWLEEANVQLILTPSIGENLHIYESGASDMFTATQHEYFRERKTHPDLVPIIHYDRSFGGDIVMANKTNEELVNSGDVIDLYLETDTVNEEMANYWIADNNISKKRVRIHARDQDEIVKMKSDGAASPMVLVTYNPHNLILERNGFHEIASTKNDNYLVIDAVYASSHLYRTHKETFYQLSDAAKRAMKAYETDPKEFYEKVKPYFGNPTYAQFVAMKYNVQWFASPPSAKLTQRLKSMQFPIKDLIR